MTATALEGGETTPREASVPVLGPSGFTTVATREWGPPRGAAVILLHGLTRNAHDFDVLLPALERALRSVHAAFGALSDDQWRHLAAHSARKVAEGWRLHYDPAIAAPFAERPPEDVVLWPVWDKIACPTLVLRGAESDLLG